MKKSESDSESEQRLIDVALETLEIQREQIRRLQKRVRELEGEVEAMQKGDNTGFRHENDGGWFE